MAHAEQLGFISLVREHLVPQACDTEMLEIGSYDVNGTVRSVFAGCARYVGVDLIEGPGVDIVSAGEDLKLPPHQFDLSLCCECFEHSPAWLAIFQNMIRMTKPGGLVVFTCASRGRLEHGTSRTTPHASPGTRALGQDYYRNLNICDFTRNAHLAEDFAEFRFYKCRVTHDLYFVGRLSGGPVSDPGFSKLDEGMVQLGRGPKRPKTARDYLWLLHTDYPLRLISHLVRDETFQNIALKILAAKAALRRKLWGAAQ